MFSCKLGVLGDELATHAEELSTALFPIEHEISKKLYMICLQGYGSDASADWKSDGYWTQTTKKALSDMGTQRGYLVYPQEEKGGFHGQWLFDLVWVDARRDEAGHFDYKETRGLKLACESEWKANEESILEDFIKLTFAFADLRLFIYTNIEVRVGSQYMDPAALCKSACPISRGHRYLLIGFPPNDKGKYAIHGWTA